MPLVVMLGDWDGAEPGTETDELALVPAVGQAHGAILNRLIHYH